MQDLRLEFLRPKMDQLFEKKEAFESRTKKDYNSAIRAGREFRNPCICDKLIEKFKIQQYGTNLERDRPEGEDRSYKKPHTITSDKRSRSDSSRRHHHHNNHHHHSTSHRSSSSSSSRR